MLNQVNQFFQNYKELLRSVWDLRCGYWSMFDTDKRFGLNFSADATCEVVTRYLEQELLNGDIVQSEKLHNIISRKIFEIESNIGTLEINIYAKTPIKESLDSILEECPNLKRFFEFEVVTETATVPDLFTFVKTIFEQEKRAIESLFYLKELNKENNNIITKDKVESKIIPKIKWLGNASHLGNVIFQLAEKGFIEFPLHNGEINYTGLAERVLNAFEFIKDPPSKKYLSEQINPESPNNKLSDVNEVKLNINLPYLSDLS